jgi:CheY-like chemotaxis protein
MILITSRRRRKPSQALQVPAETSYTLEIIKPASSTLVCGGRNGLLPSNQANGANKNREDNLADRRKDNNPSDSSTLPAYRIMVVDDEPDAVYVLKMGLERKGFHVVGYTNPVKALSNFARHRYDIVLTDIRMPQMNGIDLFRQLRAIDKEVLICFLSAFEQYRQDFEIAHPEEQPGCFITKPISIDRLVGTITRKMEERESRWRKGI